MSTGSDSEGSHWSGTAIKPKPLCVTQSITLEKVIINILGPTCSCLLLYYRLNCLLSLSQLTCVTRRTGRCGSTTRTLSFGTELRILWDLKRGKEVPPDSCWSDRCSLVSQVQRMRSQESYVLNNVDCHGEKHWGTLSSDEIISWVYSQSMKANQQSTIIHL